MATAKDKPAPRKPPVEKRLDVIEKRIGSIEESHTLSTDIMGRIGALDREIVDIRTAQHLAERGLNEVRTEIAIVKEKTREVRTDVGNNTQITIGLKNGLDRLSERFQEHHERLKNIDERTRENVEKLDQLTRNTDEMVSFAKGLKALNGLVKFAGVTAKGTAAIVSAWVAIKLWTGRLWS